MGSEERLAASPSSGECFVTHSLMTPLALAALAPEMAVYLLALAPEAALSLSALAPEMAVYVLDIHMHFTPLQCVALCTVLLLYVVSR